MAESGGSTRPKSLIRQLGLRLTTGAADDDPCAIGTYAAVGAQLGTAFLWLAPVAFPLMFAVVYVSAKLGRVTGRGLFELIRSRYPRWLLWVVLLPTLLGNTAVVAADLGAMAAVAEMFVPIPHGLLAAAFGISLFALQVLGSYRQLRRLFRWLSLSLLSYVGAALFAKPDWNSVARGTFVPRLTLDRDSLPLLVAALGTSLSAYVFTWQVNQEVEEQRHSGAKRPSPRRAAAFDLGKVRGDVAVGMFFASLIMYFIMLATGSTLHPSGRTQIGSAADAAEALKPLAGEAARALFATGVLGVGALAVPVVSAAAAYALCQTLSWPSGLDLEPKRAKAFYGTIALVVTIALGANWLGLNPMQSLVYASIAQAFAAPPLLLLVLLMTNDRGLMADAANDIGLKLLAGLALLVTAASCMALVVNWLT